MQIKILVLTSTIPLGVSVLESSKIAYRLFMLSTGFILCPFHLWLFIEFLKDFVGNFSTCIQCSLFAN